MQTAGDDPADVVATAARDRTAVIRLQRRADFQRVGKGRRWHGKAFTLQAAPREVLVSTDTHSCARVGFTLTKKVGCAVVRNRARRRLRDAVRLAGVLPLQPDCDYVIVGRIEAIRVSFASLKRELGRAVRAVHDAGKRSSGERAPSGGGTRHGGRIDATERAKVAGPARAGSERTRPKP